MEGNKLSNRLTKVAEWINKGGVVADIGTDHGYLPIFVASNNIAKKVIAMDVRKKPLEKASANVKAYRVTDKVDIRLSNGLEALKIDEADTVTICGMGGKLIQTILKNGKDKLSKETQIIVSPQSEIREFRQFLNDYGFTLIKETMLLEDNQYYVIMDLRWEDINDFNDMENIDYDFNAAEDINNSCDNVKVSENDINNIDQYEALVKNEAFLRYGEVLIRDKNDVLLDYLEHEALITEKVLEKVTKVGALKRIEELKFDLDCINFAMNEMHLR